MKQLRSNVIRAGLEALYFTGAHRLFRPIFAGVGSIFMLHHVRPARETAFQPNSHLEVTPEFLREVLAHLRSRNIDIIPMDELHRRMSERDFSRRFASFTFDDGYRDNRDFALPIMREFDAPFTVYVASDFAQGKGNLWWIALEMAIARASTLEATIDGVTSRIDTSTLPAKKLGLRAPARLAARIARPRRSCPRDRQTLHPAWRRPIRDLPRPLHVMGRSEAICRRSPRRHRRAFGDPLQPRPAIRRNGKPGNGDEPFAD